MDVFQQVSLILSLFWLCTWLLRTLIIYYYMLAEPRNLEFVKAASLEMLANLAIGLTPALAYYLLT